MLDLIMAKVWSDLSIPVGGIPNPFRLMQLATVDTEGQPKVSTVVLRHADESTKSLIFYVDRRSAKFAEILAEPRVGLTSVDPSGRLQLRIEGLCESLSDVLLLARHWEQARGRTQALFRHGSIPGEAISSPSSAYEAHMDGFENFAVVVVHLRKIEWLDLTQDIHLRARFILQGEYWQAGWIAP
ncbi:pyridoxamine 5'-phosphate oxidase family protein [Pseudomonas sichuanensis]|uniref:pyridoxamine 5'-phosphate oxidase family protein n=1 Tax=Pseudomonas sichuanensis TaxID=2213015 RepID=UPI00215EFFCE|nr:pyridoxamine 5'-phosphate oxidase family protein [Pseudomonas sichuanensis]UVK85057.1 pyridoxamine 5'-phosphate oxidase family protein [Pseudomonas sichuanensis]